MKGQVIAHRLPVCPNRDSRFTLRRNTAIAGDPWWVHYKDATTITPADLPHAALVEIVNELKTQEGQQEGGAFSINEHGQVIARMSAPPEPGQGNAVHVIGLVHGVVVTYSTPIRFGALDPTATPDEGDPWTGPLCGMTYTFTAPGHRRPPSRMLDEVVVEIEGQIVQLSTARSIAPYPPVTGELADFLQALRRQLPPGGRFRVNEHGRAFTSDSNAFIGCVPLGQWFPRLHPRS